jgi:hypothetical protein
MTSPSRVGQQIRATHPYGFRCGTWGTITGQGQDGPRELYEVTFDDGFVDWWVVHDPSDLYEFSEA